jgi:hypothetical protein
MAVGVLLGGLFGLLSNWWYSWCLAHKGGNGGGRWKDSIISGPPYVPMRDLSHIAGGTEESPSNSEQVHTAWCPSRNKSMAIKCYRGWLTSCQYAQYYLTFKRGYDWRCCVFSLTSYDHQPLACSFKREHHFSYFTIGCRKWSARLHSQYLYPS